MAQHGYLGDGYGARGDHGDDDYYRNDDRDFRDRDRERGSRDRSFGDRDREHDRDRGFMFDDRERSRPRDEWRGPDRDRMTRSRDHDDDRGFMDRARESARGWFDDDDDHQRGRQQQQRGWGGQEPHDQRPTFGGFGNQTGWETSGRGSSGWESQNRSRPSAHPDDHYRSWRQRQMQALDRDYQDYCREREQQFHSEFDNWRQSRQQQGGQSGQSAQSGQDPRMAHRMSQSHLQTDTTTTGTGALSNAPDPGGLASGAGAEVGAGSAPGHEPTSVGSGSELAGATGSMINEGSGGASGRRKGV